MQIVTALRPAFLTRLAHVPLIALGLTASAVAAGHAAAPCADPAMRFVKIGETVTACLPPNWIDSVARSEIDGDLLLFALWPGLGGFYDGQERSRPYNGQEHGGGLCKCCSPFRTTSIRCEIGMRTYSVYSHLIPGMSQRWGWSTGAGMRHQPGTHPRKTRCISRPTTMVRLIGSSP